tara:strand:+ start:220 stop:420 length:201 start_codon:yes stop_codon:yes gene_type:complete
MAEQPEQRKNNRHSISLFGMSRRDYFAGQAVKGLLAKYGIDGNHHMTAHAKDAYDIADYMEKERTR